MGVLAVPDGRFQAGGIINGRKGIRDISGADGRASLPLCGSLRISIPPWHVASFGFHHGVLRCECQFHASVPALNRRTDSIFPSPCRRTVLIDIFKCACNPFLTVPFPPHLGQRPSRNRPSR